MKAVGISTLLRPRPVIGLYFSAHWCPPCRRFTPKLVETYKSLKAAGKQFEIIFISSDHGPTQFEEYFGGNALACRCLLKRVSSAKLPRTAWA
eukprot:jgi/Botrbrau1/15699/Bobra.4_1s0072.1